MKNLDPSKLVEQIAAGTAPAVLDVRSRAEFEQGHVPGAIHIPFWQVAARADLLSADKEREIVVYCGHGPRAYIAGAQLRGRGFRRVTYLAGHFTEWRALNFPMQVDK
jgi:rhodanese-related sulfurtransferase